MLLGREKHFGDPCITPIELFLGLTSVHDLPYSLQICSTNSAEFDFITLIRGASWTSHKQPPIPVLVHTTTSRGRFGFSPLVVNNPTIFLNRPSGRCDKSHDSSGIL